MKKAVITCALVFGFTSPAMAASISDDIAAKVAEAESEFYDLTSGTLNLPTASDLGDAIAFDACGKAKANVGLVCLFGASSKACVDAVTNLVGPSSPCSWNRICLREEARDKFSALEEMKGMWCKANNFETDPVPSLDTVCGQLAVAYITCKTLIYNIPKPPKSTTSKSISTTSSESY